MTTEFFLSLFIMAVGLSFAGAFTHLYQGISNETAKLRFDGENYLGSLGLLAMSFLCGPYIMMKLGWHGEDGSAAPVGNMLLGSMVGFGWGFINGLLLLGLFFAITG